MLYCLESLLFLPSSRLTVLFRALSNQIILQCVSTVDLDEILINGRTHWGIGILNNCITCCEHYKVLYDKVNTW